MVNRLRRTGLAGSGAILLVLAVSGVVAAGSILTAVAAPTVDPTEPAEATLLTWEDLDGDGIDDDCDDEVVEDAEAALAADEAVDANADGVVSTTEAAHSDRVGGLNCNHGGYVSAVARGLAEACEDAEDPTTEEPVLEAPEVTEAICAEEETDEETEDETTDETEAACEATEEEPVEETPADEGTEEPVEVVRNAHGKLVSAVAQSDAVGGKNCNHGGAVSEAAKKDQEAARAAREAEKAAREAERAAEKAERDAAREAKTHGKGSKGKGANGG